MPGTEMQKAWKLRGLSPYLQPPPAEEQLCSEFLAYNEDPATKGTAPGRLHPTLP